MPIVTIDCISDTFSGDQKRELIARLTDAMVEVEGEAMRDMTWVRINEVAEGDWGIGGRPITAYDLHRIASDRAAPALQGPARPSNTIKGSHQ